MATVKTVTMVKNETRVKTVEDLRNALVNLYGEENVYKVGDSEFSCMVGISPTGEEMYVNFAPTVKEYQNRTATKKSFVAYNGRTESEKYNNMVVEKNNKKAELAKAKAEKIERDKAARAKAKAAKAENKD